ncbi:ADC synthase [Aspergillus minisclerotigenes]|uniref:aminodeoxychorismate synthase n=1 Tax=Aspergillus minisclerotigenes TaxID=656917 RepID=A0A5N6JCF3_9EURO|nr:ADC synthase [Aspergillus minisclerotigenes]
MPGVQKNHDDWESPSLDGPNQFSYETGQLSRCQNRNGHGSSRKRILYIDAYDSFAYNVVAMLEETLDVDVTVRMIDSSWPNDDPVAFLHSYEAVVLGPGPGNPNCPQDVGIHNTIWGLHASDLVPTLGICLGFQSLCLHIGIPIKQLPNPFHGQVHAITTTKKDIFEGVHQYPVVTLYHSLYAAMEKMGDHLTTKVRSDIDTLAWLPVSPSEIDHPGYIPMAIRHKKKPFWGVQFHPESSKSDKESCDQLLRNWWEMVLDYNQSNGPARQNPVSHITFQMLNWSTSTSDVAASRTLAAKSLNAEKICETFNRPDSPTVLFQSNGRYSIISVPSPSSWRLEYSAKSRSIRLTKLGNHDGAGSPSSAEDDLSVSEFWDALRSVMDAKKVNSGNPSVPFWGGFLGFFSYEMGLACLQRPKMHEEAYNRHVKSEHLGEERPDASLLWTERSIVLDNETGQVTIQSTIEEDNYSSGWINAAVHRLENLVTGDSSGDGVSNDNVNAGSKLVDSVLSGGSMEFPEEKKYRQEIEECQRQLEAGESYELCLTCEASITLPSPKSWGDRMSFPWELYKRLRKYNPAKFSAYGRLGNVKIASSSPECFLNWDRESMLEMKPMKGTVPKTPEMTLKTAKEILGTTKEMAENLMIADLIRHDLYGICGPGQVHVEKLLEVEDHGRVYQMITHVKGKIDRKQSGLAPLPQLPSSHMSGWGLTALQQCLPPGSMTGAPKERSCMHLSSIENRNRGIYSGVMGFLDLGGGGSFSVLIRTAFSYSDDQEEAQKWRIGAGGAVTVLSSTQGEWQEMFAKLSVVSAIFKPRNVG